MCPRTEPQRATARERSATRREFHVFARHLLGRRVRLDAALTDRYAQAVEHHAAAAAPSAVLELARRRPGLVGVLDAGCGLVRPGDGLRRRLLIAAAILEATPTFARDFLPRHNRLPVMVWRLGFAGARAALLAVAGAPLVLLVAGRSFRG